VILRYSYGHANLLQASGRSLQMEFNHDGLLVDYLYTSTFREDRTPASVKDTDFGILAARRQLIPGQTRKAEVAILLGTNYDVLPFNKPGVDQRWYYSHSQKSKTETTTAYGQTIPKTHSKWLAIDFDTRGIVQHISGESDFAEDLSGILQK
jgi:outer membrane protein assembly factor BamE (lipoprotein component of BamABCDE complex)